MDIANEMKTYVLYAPPRAWGSQWKGMNFRSKLAVEKKRSPRKALEEWLALADAIIHAGGNVAVIPEPDEDNHKGAYIASLCNMANAGELFFKNGNPVFLISRMNPVGAPLRQNEWKFVQRFIKEHLGIYVQRSHSIWEGQADLLHLPPRKAIMTYGTTRGVRSSQGSLVEIDGYLHFKTQTLYVELVYPFFHGDTALAYYALPQENGKRIFLYCPEALMSSKRELIAFVEPHTDLILPITKEEGMVYATNTLQVNDTLIMNRDVSHRIKNTFAKVGFRIAELDLSELFGKGGGGPRCLVNIVRHFDVLLRAPQLLYRNCRKAIVDLLPTYPA